MRHAENTDRRNYPTAADDAAWLDATVAAIERMIVAEGADTVAAVVLEPVQNAGGCLVPPDGYGPRLRELCDRHGILLWCDEVITGFGRLGAWLGSDLLGFDADIVTFAKGITSGQAPLGGMLFTDDVAAPLLDGGALYAHGFTFGGHPLSCAVALANLAIMRREGVVENVQQLEEPPRRAPRRSGRRLRPRRRGPRPWVLPRHRATRRVAPSGRPRRDPPKRRHRPPRRPREPLPCDLPAAHLERRGARRDGGRDRGRSGRSRRLT